MIFLLFDKTIGKIVRLFDRSHLSEIAKDSVNNSIKLIAFQESAKYATDQMSGSMIFEYKEDLWRYCFDKANLNINLLSDPLIIEFGV